ncbi:MAG TPA: DUF4918 family protein [Saprospiraceae bacterium]|nr:DUF4918 family protein [Saprospiraceae bacterium]
MQILSDRILDFYANVHFEGCLPDGIKIMNPYRESAEIRDICGKFYSKYYSDHNPRKLILGINPGRLGAGATGLPFTDTKRLNDHCGIPYDGFVSHEPSSVFIYDVIHAFGGPDAFYRQFYINSVCPLGFTIDKTDGKSVNYNYYDSIPLEKAVRDFIIENIKVQISLAGRNDICYCLGTGKNYTYLSKLNEKYKFFGTIIPLEHPRYVMQYKSKSKEKYVDDYLGKLSLFA